MRVFGRPIRRYVASLARAPQYFGELVRCVRLFKAPGSVLWAYLTRRPLPRNRVELRSGLHIHLSADPLDIVTVFGVFMRRDYGEIPPGSRVIDIGANIGVFALYAVHCGARLVHAYEPSAESFKVLQRNIDDNRLGERVKAFRVAVGAGPERPVLFPRSSNVMNVRPTDGTDANDCDEVPLETLQTVVARTGGAELVKLDCEGEEEHILADARAPTLSQLKEVRLEYHLGRGAVIMRGMEQRGFDVVHHWPADARGGLVWFKQSAQQANAST